MNVFVLDSNCMIAALCIWHQHNAAARAEIDRRFGRGERLSVPAPALVETYSVLTRLPAPYRLSPSDAWALLKQNFLAGSSVVALDSAEQIAVLEGLASQGLGGGRTYDALIAVCARRAKATTLLTFNRRHFEPPPEGVTVLEPA